MSLPLGNSEPLPQFPAVPTHIPTKLPTTPQATPAVGTPGSSADLTAAVQPPLSSTPSASAASQDIIDLTRSTGTKDNTPTSKVFAEELKKRGINDLSAVKGITYQIKSDNLQTPFQPRTYNLSTYQKGGKTMLCADVTFIATYLEENEQGGIQPQIEEKTLTIKQTIYTSILVDPEASTDEIKAQLHKAAALIDTYCTTEVKEPLMKRAEAKAIEVSNRYLAQITSWWGDRKVKSAEKGLAKAQGHSVIQVNLKIDSSAYDSTLQKMPAGMEKYAPEFGAVRGASKTDGFFSSWNKVHAKTLMRQLRGKEQEPTGHPLFPSYRNVDITLDILQDRSQVVQSARKKIQEYLSKKDGQASVKSSEDFKDEFDPCLTPQNPSSRVVAVQDAEMLTTIMVKETNAGLDRVERMINKTSSEGISLASIGSKSSSSKAAGTSDEEVAQHEVSAPNGAKGKLSIFSRNWKKPADEIHDIADRLASYRAYKGELEPLDASKFEKEIGKVAERYQIKRFVAEIDEKIKEIDTQIPSADTDDEKGILTGQKTRLQELKGLLDTSNTGRDKRKQYPEDIKASLKSLSEEYPGLLSSIEIKHIQRAVLELRKYEWGSKVSGARANELAHQKTDGTTNHLIRQLDEPLAAIRKAKEQLEDNRKMLAELTFLVNSNALDDSQKGELKGKIRDLEDRIKQIEPRLNDLILDFNNRMKKSRGLFDKAQVEYDPVKFTFKDISPKPAQPAQAAQPSGASPAAQAPQVSTLATSKKKKTRIPPGVSIPTKPLPPRPGAIPPQTTPETAAQQPQTPPPPNDQVDSRGEKNKGRERAEGDLDGLN